MPRPAIVLIALAGLVGVAAYAAGGRTVPPAAPVVEFVEQPASLTLHVSGAVAHPGLVEVPSGSRLADAVAAAGGATEAADLGAINLAEAVVDGAHVVVPGLGGSEEVGDGRIRVNVASVDELTSLPGIGPVLAQRIVDHRDAMGDFEQAEDLLDVSGIGERLLAGLRDQVAIP